MTQRYTLYKNNIEIGETDRLTQVYILAGCSKQHWYKTIIAKIEEGRFTFKGDEFKIFDKLNPN